MRHINFTSAPLSDDDTAELSSWLEHVPSLPLLSADEEATATPEMLVNHNLRLAVKLACKYAGRGMPVSDLCQEASLGLMRAARTFDAEKGRFSTYATNAIINAVVRAVHNHGSSIRLPAHIREGRRGTASAETLRQAGAVKHVESLDDRSKTHVSGRDTDSRNTTLLEATPDPGADTAGDALARVEAQERRALLARLLGRLNERERLAVELHFVQGMTFEQCAGPMGCSKQRVHQLVNEARRKMRALYVEHQEAA